MSTTVGVLSILEGPARRETERLWRLFETEYGSRRAQTFPHPHLTFLAGACLDVAELDEALSELCLTLDPFEVIIDGLGYFDAPAPVIFMQVEPTEALLTLHHQIVEFMGFHCVDLYENYLPDIWVPHVTLARGDLTPANCERAWSDLQGYRPRYREVLSNAHLVRRDGETGLVEFIARYSCGRREAGDR
jgi:2'-5' RNA ligase